MTDWQEYRCRSLAKFILEDEPCADDPALYARHIDTMTDAIKKAIEHWFSTPDE